MKHHCFLPKNTDTCQYFFLPNIIALNLSCLYYFMLIFIYIYFFTLVRIHKLTQNSKKVKFVK